MNNMQLSTSWNSSSVSLPCIQSPRRELNSLHPDIYQPDSMNSSNKKS
jgi:hypothetical protein